MNRIDILKMATKITGEDRNITYGNPFVNMQHFANLLNTYFLTDMFEAEDAAVVMVLAKMSRIKNGVTLADNYIDGAAYLAIAGECALDCAKTTQAIPHPLKKAIDVSPEEFRSARNAAIDKERQRIADQNKQAASSQLVTDGAAHAEKSCV